jgi:RimJ/RimL family protein N-acetyltransferase
VLGFSAATFSSRSGYAYEYFIGVDPAARGRRIGWALVDFMLRQAREKGMLRLKLKSENVGAHRFWASFGLRPFARRGEQFCWDADIAPVNGAAGLIEWMKHPSMHVPIPESAMRRWLSSGAEAMTPEAAGEALR